MNIEPTGHHVLVLPDEVETVTKGGIVIPDIDKGHQLREAASTTGTIVAVGPTAWEDSGLSQGKGPWAKVDDHVYFKKHSAVIIKDEETEIKYFLLTDDNILAKIEK